MSEQSNSPVEPAESSAHSERLLPSLAFWSCLAVSAAMFTAVFLSPRLRTYRELNRQYDSQQRELVAFERNVEYLHKVVDALRHDPDFAAELARVDFGIAGSEERIPVAVPLSLNGEPVRQAASAPGTSRSFRRSLLDTALVDTLSDDRSVRARLLAAASLLVLVAFTLLCESGPPLSKVETVRWRTRFRNWFADRYAAPKPAVGK